jgi:formylmethanofuran dehydrogenase subunit E
MNQSKLDTKKQLEQQIHNLKNTFPTGITSIDNYKEQKLKKYQQIYKEQYEPLIIINQLLCNHCGINTDLMQCEHHATTTILCNPCIEQITNQEDK